MAVAWGQVRGRVVFDSAWCGLTEQAATGFSLAGSRSLLLTDYPAVYVHDTGGFGMPSVTALEPAGDPAATISLTGDSTQLAAEITFPGGRSVKLASTSPLAPETLARLTGLAGRLLPDAGTAVFASPCAVSVTPAYESEPEPGTDPPAAELAAYVVVTNGRLELRSGGGTLLSWPANRVAASPAGPAGVELRGGAVLAGRFLTGATLHLVTPHVRQAFLAALGPAGPDPATVGTTAPVTARGLAGTAGSRVDCVLGEAVLELQGQDTGTVLARFDLTDPRLRVAGSAERFVVFTPEHGPVTVQSDSELFGQRLRAHPGLHAAAGRTLATGPYPAELADGQPVACAVAADAVRIKGPGTDLRLPFAQLRSVAGTGTAPRAVLRLATAGGAEVALAGQLELVQALHIEIATGNHATADPRQLPDQLRAAVGLEEDYFLYTVFGPFYELHAALLGDAGPDRLAEPVPAPGSDPEQARVAVGLADGLAELQRHLDQVGAVLPAFVRHRDAQLLAPLIGAEPDWLKVQEGQLRAAFAPVGRAAAETAALAAQAARLRDLDPDAVPPASYAGAAVSLGAAALLNPVFAVAGASQAYSQHSQREKRKAELSAQAARGWALLLDRWNALVGTSLPVLGYLLTEQLFGPRWEAARQVTAALGGLPAERRPAAQRAVAARLARLDVLRRYPGHPGLRLRRGEIAEHLRAARDTIRTPRFADF